MLVSGRVPFFVVAFGIRQHFLLPSLAFPTAPAQVVRAVNGIRANVFFGLRNDGGRIENIHFPGKPSMQFQWNGGMLGFFMGLRLETMQALMIDLPQALP